MKTCSKCLISKDSDEFYFRKDTGSYRSSCKDCVRKNVRSNSLKNPERKKTYAKSYYENNKQAFFDGNKRRYHAGYKHKAKEYRSKWYWENREEYLLGRKTYYQNNKAGFRARDAKRRAIEIQAMPKWADPVELKRIYDNCPDGYEVDHIVPLNHPQVCGLHVPANLQYLVASENRSKGNKFESSARC